MSKPTSPFPALHTAANKEADDNVVAARKLVDDATAWLAELDELLEDASR